jgi:hypothetical protein
MVGHPRGALSIFRFAYSRAPHSAQLFHPISADFSLMLQKHTSHLGQDKRASCQNLKLNQSIMAGYRNDNIPLDS